MKCRKLVEAWFDLSNVSQSSTVLSYEVLLPIMGILEVQELIEAAVKGGQRVPAGDEQVFLL